MITIDEKALQNSRTVSNFRDTEKDRIWKEGYNNAIDHVFSISEPVAPDADIPVLEAAVNTFGAEARFHKKRLGNKFFLETNQDLISESSSDDDEHKETENQDSKHLLKK